MSLRLIAGWALLTLAVPAASQGLPPATPDEILAAARSCAAATSSAGLDLKKLEAAQPTAVRVTVGPVVQEAK